VLFRSIVPSALPASYGVQLWTCSSDRKRFMPLQAKAMFSAQRENGTLTCPTMEEGEASRMTPSRIRTRIGSLQSRQGQSIWTSLPG